MALRQELVAVARLDFAEVIRSRWLVFCGAVYALLAAVFVFVGMRESTLLGFSGMGRVLLSLSHALVLLLPLLALTATGQVVNRARDDGTLELLFTQPIRREAFYLAVTLVRSTVLIAPLAVLLLVMGAGGSIAFGQQIPWALLGRAVALSAALLACFVGVGLAVSTLVRSQARATLAVLLIWALGVALVDFGLIGAMLQWRLNPQTVFALAALNPVQAARVALLSSASPELTVLGPVGFFLFTRLGETALLVIGVVWPVLFGGLAWSFALSRFRRGDLV